MVKKNLAQKIYIAIGGTAALVGGYMEHYYTDFQTPKRVKKEKLGGFAKGLRDLDTQKNKERMKK